MRAILTGMIMEYDGTFYEYRPHIMTWFVNDVAVYPIQVPAPVKAMREKLLNTANGVKS